MSDQSDHVVGLTPSRERMAHGNVYAPVWQPDRVVYHCFDRIVIRGYLSMLSRPENVVYFFHKVVGIPLITKEVLVQRTHDYQRWAEGVARQLTIATQW